MCLNCIYSINQGEINIFKSGLNIGKFVLSIVSIIFNLTFIFQHYCLYRGNEPPEEENSAVMEEENDEKKQLIEPFVNDDINKSSHLTNHD
jgi:amino acid permease